MGKLGVVSLAVIAGMVTALLPAREAAAQDFGQEWIDRITHEQQQERGPLSPKAFNWTGDVGAQYAYDNNIFLTQTGKKSDNIIIPFVQAGLSYAEQRFEVEASLLANYKIYTKNEDTSHDEERFFLHARQVGNRWNFEVSQLFVNVSDPSGVVFLNRVTRNVSTTTPKVAFDIARNWTFELDGAIQTVRFVDQFYSQGQENDNFRIAGSLVYRTSLGFDLVGQFGYYHVNYLQPRDEPHGTPDFFGYIATGGFRGQIFERLSLEGQIGYMSAQTDFFPNGAVINDSNLTVTANFRYEASQTVTFFLDFQRLYTFNGFGDPFQLVNSAVIIGQLEMSEGFTLRARAQYDRSESALKQNRDYLNGNVGASYKIGSHWLIDGSAGYRWGKTDSGPAETKFNDVLFQLGVAFTW
jgi:hypothetical protein